jgi:hypothetical protein
MPITLIAQQTNLGRPFTRNYAKNAYKAGTQNWDIIQDERVLVYFANNEGLLQLKDLSLFILLMKTMCFLGQKRDSWILFQVSFPA